MNLKSYYPDFVAMDGNGVFWLFETKGQQTVEVAYKDKAANLWCENATSLAKETWKYLKVPQKDFETLQPNRLAHLLALSKFSDSVRLSAQ